MLVWILIIAVVVLVGLFLYWQLIVAEGAYLGASLVALLYDWTAERYNRIKQFDEVSEDLTLGRPLADRLAGQAGGLVLDVATGTGRIPLNLFRQSSYQGYVVGLDRASKMLNVARRDTAPAQDRVILIQADAMALPFANNSVPLVTCMEALEFLPDPQKGLAELVRVLHPASPACPSCGWLLFTQRIGWEARLMPGKTWSRPALVRLLQELALGQFTIQPWQDIYNLVWAQKIEL
jgi:ubiquinone/menaquinone biosynthesis C-methylase UbiE